MIETHPFEPFIPEGATTLIMGTFPPQPKRWAMEFYYPNRTNDFWPMMGPIFFGDRHALYDPQTKRFDLPAIKRLLSEKGIAMSDTGYRIDRLRDNASDKYLEILEPVDLAALLRRMLLCQPHTNATTGEKAAGVVARLTGTEPPKMGEMTLSAEGLHIWRMPSTSRAYPLALEKKAAFYRRMLPGVPEIAYFD